MKNILRSALIITFCATVSIGFTQVNAKLGYIDSNELLEIIYRETEALYNKSILTVRLCELRNIINIGYLIIKMALARKESRGLHFSIDYPHPKENDGGSIPENGLTDF